MKELPREVERPAGFFITGMAVVIAIAFFGYAYIFTYLANGEVGIGSYLLIGCISQIPTLFAVLFYYYEKWLWYGLPVIVIGLSPIAVRFLSLWLRLNFMSEAAETVDYFRYFGIIMVVVAFSIWCAVALWKKEFTPEPKSLLTKDEYDSIT